MGSSMCRVLKGMYTLPATKAHMPELKREAYHNWVVQNVGNADKYRGNMEKMVTDLG